MGINPTPTLDVCCYHFDNPLIAIVLHTSAVGAGFIPALLTADKIQSKYPEATRVGINPTPTVTECCYRSDNPLITKVLHTSTVGMGFIPVLPTTDKIQSKYPAAAREGMKPSPTVAECCYLFDNPLIAKVLHTSAVGAGFIPVLPTADKIQSKYHAAAREGMKPSPTVAECCYRFDNPLIAKVLHTSAVGAWFIPALPTADKN